VVASCRQLLQPATVGNWQKLLPLLQRQQLRSWQLQLCDFTQHPLW
jgi:hypothetical protein